MTYELQEHVEGLLARIFEELSYHPFIAPYLNTSRISPLQHYIHQCEVVGRLALRKPIRVLIGDEIGLGKTITALSVAKYLEKLGRVRRVLIIVPRVLVMQWRKELLRIGIPESKIQHLERSTIGFLKLKGFPEGYYIASMDLIKKEERISEIVKVPWDLIVIDEVHKFGYKTRRFWLGKTLVEASPSRDVLFLSATPHRGDPQDYIARLQLLDPYLVEGWKSMDTRRFYESTHAAILFRRTKEDVNKIYEEKEVFLPAKFYAGVISARRDEAVFIERLITFLRGKLIEFAYEKNLISEKVIPLLVVLIFKRAASSPYAAFTTLERLLIRRTAPDFTEELIDSVYSFLGVEYSDYEYLERDPDEIFNEFIDSTRSLLSQRDVEEITVLHDMAKSIMEKGDSKLNALISLLESVMVDEGSKVIVFTEYRDTANYLRESIIKKHPEWSASILKLTSEETSDEDKFQRIKNAFETNPKARILIATDVIAEGVNLQVAHILVNYEIPWSLIKVEQRIGRVWRLGQKREVEAYTLFMNNIADLTALNSMYQKLIALKKAELQPRPVTGQEVLLYADTEELMKPPPPAALIVDGKKKKFVKVTEAKAILTFLKEDKAGLEKLVASIIAARQEVEKDLLAKNVLYKPKTRQEVESFTSLLGFKTPARLLEALRNLVEASSEILGFKILKTENSVKVSTGLEMAKPIDTMDDIYGLFARKQAQNIVGSKTVSLVAYGESEDTTVLLPVEVRDRKSGLLLYRELVGVEVKKKNVLRGEQLLSFLSEKMANCLGLIEVTEPDLEIPVMNLAEIINTMKESSAKILEPITHYTLILESLKLRNADKTWIRLDDIEITPLEPIAHVHIVAKPTDLSEASEEMKRKVEETAIGIVIEKEKEEGRIPERVAESEHYDIKSVNPETGEVRIIEVKGHAKPEVYAELTEDEAILAEKEGDRYWLYIVYDIASDNPKLLRFRDPLKTMNLKALEKIIKRYILWPRSLKSDENWLK
ncbi:MAG: helicase-related protein [Thermoproteota archaeon]